MEQCSGWVFRKSLLSVLFPTPMFPSNAITFLYRIFGTLAKEEWIQRIDVLNLHKFFCFFVRISSTKSGSTFLLLCRFCGFWTSSTPNRSGVGSLFSPGRSAAQTKSSFTILISRSLASSILNGFGSFPMHRMLTYKDAVSTFHRSPYLPFE